MRHPQILDHACLETPKKRLGDPQEAIACASQLLKLLRPAPSFRTGRFWKINVPSSSPSVWQGWPRYAKVRSKVPKMDCLERKIHL